MPLEFLYLSLFIFYKIHHTLTTYKILRFFENPIFIDSNNYYYFSTQWNGEGDYPLSFNNLKDHFERSFKEYRLEKKDGIFCLYRLQGNIIVSFYKDLNNYLPSPYR